MSNYGLIRFKRFISSFIDKLCNWLFFKLYLILYACVQKFDVMENLEFFWKLNMATNVMDLDCVQFKACGVLKRAKKVKTSHNGG